MIVNDVLDVPRERRPQQPGVPQGRSTVQGVPRAPGGVQEAGEPGDRVCKVAQRHPGRRGADRARSRRPTARRARLPLADTSAPGRRRPALDADGPRGPDDGRAHGRLRPRPGQPARPGDGDRDDHPPHPLQLLVFVVITLLGVSYVGARYARLDRLFFDDTYTVVAHFADSGGIFAGGEVSYRGVHVGRVERAGAHRRRASTSTSTSTTSYDDIPADTLAVVGNRSAVGEQYVELQPQTDDGPYLRDDSEIASDGHPHPDRDRDAARRPRPTPSSRSTRTPCAPSSRARHRLRRHRRGPAADHRHRQLVHQGGQRQLRRHHRADPRQQHGAAQPGRLRAARSASSPASSQLFSATLAGADQDLRTVIDNGCAAADRAAHLPRGQRGRPGRADQQPGHHRRGGRQAPRRHRADPGASTPTSSRAASPSSSKSPRHRPVRRPLRHGPDPRAAVCHAGYEGTDTRPPQDGSNRADERERRLHRARLAVQRPRRAERPPRAGRYGADWRRRVVARTTRETGELTWGESARRRDRGVRAPTARTTGVGSSSSRCWERVSPWKPGSFPPAPEDGLGGTRPGTGACRCDRPSADRAVRRDRVRRDRPRDCSGFRRLAGAALGCSPRSACCSSG